MFLSRACEQRLDNGFVFGGVGTIELRLLWAIVSHYNCRDGVDRYVSSRYMNPIPCVYLPSARRLENCVSPG